jgi:hypothetical protein
MNTECREWNENLLCCSSQRIVQKIPEMGRIGSHGWTSAGEVQNTFYMERLREEIEQVRLLHAITRS